MVKYCLQYVISIISIFKIFHNIMLNDWELVLFFFSHLWVSFSQTLSDASSASVSSPEPWDEPQRAPGPPHLGSFECLPWESMYRGVPFCPSNRPIYSIGTVVVVLFHSSSRCFLMISAPVELALLPSFQHIELWGFTPRNHYKIYVPFLSFFFFLIIYFWGPV